jgi:hypothetical protein
MTNTMTAVLLAAALAGCGAAPLDDETNVSTWTNAGSAVAVWANVNDPIAFAEGHHDFDPACPVTSDDGTTVTIEGGCSEYEGADWTGSATIVRDGGDLSLTLDDYGADPEERGTLRGTFTLTEESALTHSFDADLVHEGGITTTLHYSGTVDGDWDTATTWNGEGTVERDGMVEPTGRVSVSTTDEVLDDALCAGQAASGKTRIDDGDHVVVVTYDGATDCDSQHAAKWSFDGEDRGLVGDIYCSFAPGASRPAPWAGMFLLAAVLWIRRRA